MEGWHIKVELCKLQIAAFVDNAPDCVCPFHNGIFTIRIAAGIDKCCVFYQCSSNRLLVLLEQFFYGWLRRIYNSRGRKFITSCLCGFFGCQA